MINSKEFYELLVKNGIIKEGYFFMYKLNPTFGPRYINKEDLTFLGATLVNNILRSMAQNAIKSGLKFSKGTKKIAVIGPAYGAINYAAIVAEAIEQYNTSIIAMPTRTQLGKNDYHEIPDKLKKVYEEADEYLIVEDIVNNGETIREVKKLIIDQFSDKKVINAICLVDRNKNTAEKLEINSFYPLLDYKMDVYSLSTQEGIDMMNNSELQINETLGKGKSFIAKYGYAPYTLDQFKDIA